MFKRNKTAKSPKQNKDLVETIELQQTYSKNFDDRFAEIGRLTDDADKVLNLQELVRYIDSADDHIRQWKKYIVDTRTNKKSVLAGLTGWAAGGAVAAVPILILAPPLAGLIGTGAVIGMVTGRISTKGRIKKKSEQLVAENADLNAFQDLLVAKRAQTVKMLDETVNNCDLEKLPLCPRFQDAIMSCVPLGERFAKAAANAARKAQEEKVVQEEQQKPVSKKLRITRPPKSP